MRNAETTDGGKTEQGGGWLSRLFAPIAGLIEGARNALTEAESRASMWDRIDEATHLNDQLGVFFDAYIEGYDTSEGGIKVAIDRILRENPQLAESGHDTEAIYAAGLEQLEYLKAENPDALAALEADRQAHQDQLETDWQARQDENAL